MKDSLNDLFSGRFHGHEALVDPALWQVIEARLLTGAPATDQVNELFRERFQQHEVGMDPSVWQGISSQLGHAGAGTGLLGGYGWVAAGLAGVVVAVGTFFALSNPEEPRGSSMSLVASDPIEQPVAVPQEQEVVTPESQVAAPLAREVVPQQRSPIPQQRTTTTHATLEEPQEAGVAAVLDPAPPPLNELPPPTRPGSEVVNGILAEMSNEVRTTPVTADPEPRLGQKPPESPGEQPVGDEHQPEESRSTEAELFMPNTFTPNGDGQNDVYKVIPSVPYTIMHLRVFSLKTDQQVFSTNSGEAWTGANCEDGWYMVAVEVMTQDGRVLSEGKVVWLNRQGMY